VAFLWYCVITALLIFGAQSVGYLSSSFSSNPVVGLALSEYTFTSLGRRRLIYISRRRRLDRHFLSPCAIPVIVFTDGLASNIYDDHVSTLHTSPSLCQHASDVRVGLCGLSCAAVPVLITPMILFSGMLYERQSVRPYLRWMQDLSLVNYSYATYVLNEAR
jgi:hypothetical protein